MAESTKDCNGWEVWRRHVEFYEPNSTLRAAHAMAQFTGMVAKRAKNPAETKSLLSEMEEKLRRVEELEGELDARHAMSVLVGILDAETLKHTSELQSGKKQEDVDRLKRKAIEFCNMVAGGESKGGGINSLGGEDEE